jgi:hypothetical protein
VTDVARVIAVGETRGKLSQVAFADWLAAQCAERLWTGSPAVHQNEFHMRPPFEMFAADNLRFRSSDHGVVYRLVPT